MKLLPVGTVLDRNGNRLMVIGYGIASKTEQSAAGYYLVPYPVGFLGMDRLLFLPVSSEVTVISQGNSDDASEKILRNAAEKLEQTVDLRNRGML